MRELAITALRRLEEDGKIGFPFRNVSIRSTIPDMYRHSDAEDDGSGGGAYVVVPFKQWSAHCTADEAAAIVAYWEESGSLIR